MVSNPEQKMLSETAPLILNKNADEFVPNLVESKMESSLNTNAMAFVPNIREEESEYGNIDILDENDMNDIQSSINNISMPPIDENIELDKNAIEPPMISCSSNGSNESNENSLKSRLNRNAKEFVPLVIANANAKVFGNDSQNYGKKFVTDMSTTPFGNPFGNKKRKEMNIVTAQGNVWRRKTEICEEMNVSDRSTSEEGIEGGEDKHSMSESNTSSNEEETAEMDGMDAKLFMELTQKSNDMTEW